MNYKYRKNQLIGKQLPVPNTILHKVYSCTLSFPEYVAYDLEDKIPLSCLIEEDRDIVLRFGLHRAKKLDWETLNLHRYELPASPKKIILSIEKEEDDLNQALYKKLKDLLRPSDYTTGMKNLYPERLLAESKTVPEKFAYLFNHAQLSLEGIVSRWDIFHEKDLTSCLLNDSKNKYQLTDSQIKCFMDEYACIACLIIKIDNLYKFIWEIQQIDEKKEKEKYLRDFSEEALNRSNPDKRDYRDPVPLTEEEYEFIFQYTSLEDYLRKISPYSNSDIEKIMNELESIKNKSIGEYQKKRKNLIHYIMKITKDPNYSEPIIL